LEFNVKTEVVREGVIFTYVHTVFPFQPKITHTI
jgi:hypothetical protein